MTKVPDLLLQNLYRLTFLMKIRISRSSGHQSIVMTMTSNYSGGSSYRLAYSMLLTNQHKTLVFGFSSTPQYLAKKGLILQRPFVVRRFNGIFCLSSRDLFSSYILCISGYIVAILVLLTVLMAIWRRFIRSFGLL